MDRVGKVTQGVEGAFEAHAAKLHTMEDSGALQEGANQIVSNNVKQEFLFNHRWGQATQDVEGESDFDLPEMEFHAPAFQVKGSDVFGGISHRIKEGGYQEDGAAAAALDLSVNTDLAQGERVGQGGELVRAPGRCALARLFPADKDVVLAQAFAATEVGVSGLMQSHETIDAAAPAAKPLQRRSRKRGRPERRPLHRDGPRVCPSFRMRASAFALGDSY